MTDTQADIDELIAYMELYDSRNTFELNDDEKELIVDALIFYKESNKY